MFVRLFICLEYVFGVLLVSNQDRQSIDSFLDSLQSVTMSGLPASGTFNRHPPTAVVIGRFRSGQVVSAKYIAHLVGYRV